MKQPQSRLPKFGDWLLRLLARYDVNPHLRGDFDEEFSLVYETKGFVRAWFWYWTHLLRSLPVFIKDVLYWRSIMFKNYLKIALRNIKRHKGYSFINIASLALGIACCFLISSLIIYELSYDDFHQNSDDIYRVNMDVTTRGRQFYETWTPDILRQELISEYPEIVLASRINILESSSVSNGERAFYERCMKVDNDFFQMFSFPFVKGNHMTALTEPYSVVITEELAGKYFPDEEPIGKLLTINNEYHLQVKGVIKDIPSNSSLQFTMAVSNKPPFGFDENIGSWDGVSTQTYVQLNSEASVNELSHKIGDFIQKRIKEDRQIRLFLEPLNELRLSRYSGSLRLTLYMFSICAFAILLIACVNFMNLSTARSAGREKEIGIRKVVGAFRKNLILQFLSESLLLSFFSLLISISIAYILFPVFINLINMNTIGFTFLSLVMNPKVILVMIGITLFTGFAAGCYPAIILSGFEPVKILKGHLLRFSKGFSLRKILVVAQFSFSIILIISTVVTFNQLSFMKDKEIGYNKEHVVNIPFRTGSEKFYKKFKNQLLLDSRILKVGGISSQIPFFWQSSPVSDWEGKDPDYFVEISFSYIDYDFLEALGMPLIEGRNFSREFSTDANSFVVNQTLANEVGEASAIGKRLTFMEQTGNVVGVMKDFIFRPFNNKTRPLALMLDPDKVRFASIKIQPKEIASTLDYIEKTWKQTVPMYPFIFSFLDEDFDRSFRQVETLGRLLTTSTVISIFISCLGLLGLATYAAQQRTKEIGIRKVLGASTFQITMMLSHEFTKWVVFASIIAFPVAYFVMNQWLQNFAYRTSIGFWIFILSVLLALILGMLTVSFQAFKAAIANPVNSLRYE